MKEIPFSELKINPMTMIAKEWMLLTAGAKEVYCAAIASAAKNHK